MKDSYKSNPTQSGEEGMTYATLVISFLSIVVIICLILFFQWHIREKDGEFKNILHEKQEDAAYRFTFMKNEANQMQNRCNEKQTKNEKWEKYFERETGKKAPIELLSGQNDCLISKEIPERMPKENTGQ